MNKTRYKEIKPNEYEVILPNCNNEIIGKVYLDPFKKPNPWFIKTNFLPFLRDDKALKIGYEDFAKAGRVLVEVYKYSKFSAKNEFEDDSIFNSYVRSLKP